MDSFSDWEVGLVVVRAMLGLWVSVSVSADPTLRGARIWERLYCTLVGVARAAGRLLVGGGMCGPATRLGPAYLWEDVGI